MLEGLIWVVIMVCFGVLMLAIITALRPEPPQRLPSETRCKLCYQFYEKHKQGCPNCGAPNRG
jgi:Zn finger protein HypA/HybF involved in hydrogenase expression